MQTPSSGAGFSVLHDVNFRGFFSGSIAQHTGHRMGLLVLSWLILEKTGSPLQLGLVLVFHTLPTPFMAMPGGLIADRFSRLRIIRLTQLLNALVVGSMLALIALDVVRPWQVFLVSFLQGVVRAVELPSRRAGVLDIVGENRPVRAISLEQMTYTFGNLIGPMVGGIAIGVGGLTGAYATVLVLHVLGIFLLAPVKAASARKTQGREPVWHSLGTSIRYALHSPMLLGMLYVTFIMNLLAFPMRQFIPAVGRDFLLVGPELVGILVGAEGIGQIVGGAVIASVGGLRLHGRLFIIGSLVVTVTIMLFPWSPWYTLAFAILLIQGLANAGFGTMQSTISLMAVPKEMRGRMAGLTSVAIGAAAPIGTAEMGLVAAALGTQWAIFGNAGLAFFFVTLALIFSPLAWRPLTQQPSPAVQR